MKILNCSANQWKNSGIASLRLAVDDGSMKADVW